MDEPLMANERIDREMNGEVIRVGSLDVTPFARLQGRLGTSESKNHQFGYAWLRLRPVKFIVRDPSGRTEEIELAENGMRTAGRMGMVALSVAAVCLVIQLVRRLAL